jgi:hypothetical protein
MPPFEMCPLWKSVWHQYYKSDFWKDTKIQEVKALNDSHYFFLEEDDHYGWRENV